MANVVKCERGHYYDSSVFIKCPHCEAGGVSEAQSSGYRAEVSKLATEYLRSRRPVNTPLFSADPPTEEQPLRHRAEYAPENVRQAPAEERAPANAREGGGYSNAKDDVKTVGFAPSSQKNFCVAGWLVCVAGPHRGYSYNLYYGYNTIGYSRRNRICLMEDVTVAREEHCSVIYEDRKNRFCLVPAPGQDTYRNGEKVEGMADLQTGDVIRLGKTELEFVAFCRDGRRWEKELMQKGRGGSGDYI